MQRCGRVGVLALGLLVIAGPLAAAGSQVTPVQKVIQMLQDMIAKGQTEKDAETKVFAEYEEWVDDKSRELGFEIKHAKEAIEQLTADIAKAASDISELRKSIEAIDADIGVWEGDQKAATGVREGEADEFDKTQTDYQESLDALDRAIVVLKQQNYDRAQAEMLLQTMSLTVTGMSRVLAVYTREQARDHEQTKKQGGPLGAPDVNAYEFQSGGVVDMLKKLKGKFKKELNQLETEEANKAHAYQLEMLHLSNSIEAAKKDREERSAVKAGRTADKAEAEGTLADTQGELAEAEKFLSDTTSTHRSKTSDYKTNQEVRAAELDALSKAVEILSSNSVAGNAGKHLPGAAALAQASRRAGTSLAQLRSSSTASRRADLLKDQVIAMLGAKAKSLGSRLLGAAAAKASADPFAKVTKMISELLTRLEEEAAAEAGHKEYCDKELHDNKISREEKTSAVDTLRATAEELQAQITKLGDQITTLTQEEADLDKAMLSATKIRGEEKEKNEATIADAQEAQKAVASALAVLKEFYAKQGGALLQQKQAPEMKAYGGMQAAKGGVVGMIEVIASDFARVESDTTASEAQAASEYKSFMAESKKAKEDKHALGFKKKMKKDQIEHKLHLNGKDLKAEQEMLDAAIMYYERLKPECMEVKVSYEERVKMREEEIEALQTAYKVLNGEEV